MLESPKPNDVIEFRGWKLNVITDEVVGSDGRTVRLDEAAGRVLKFLVDNKKQLVLKEPLLKAGWKRPFVEENNLSQALTRIRSALRQIGVDPDTVIETVPKKGYKFLVSPLSPESAQTTSSHGDQPGQSILTIRENTHGEDLRGNTGAVTEAAPKTISLHKEYPNSSQINETDTQDDKPIPSSESIPEKPATVAPQRTATAPNSAKPWRRYLWLLIDYPFRYVRRWWEVIRHPFRFSDDVRETPRALFFELIWFLPITVSLIWLLQGSILWSALNILAISGLLAAAWRLVRGATSFRNDAIFLLYLAATFWLLNYAVWFAELQLLEHYSYKKISAVRMAFALATNDCLRFKDFQSCIEQVKTKSHLDFQGTVNAIVLWSGVVAEATFVAIILAGIAIAVVTLRRRNRTGARRTAAALLLFIPLQCGWLIIREVSRPENPGPKTVQLVVIPDCRDVLKHVPDTPALNPSPLMYAGIPATDVGTCGELPLIDVRNLNGKDRDTRWAADPDEHAKGIHAQRGDTIMIYVYVDNGARQDLPDPNIATDVILRGSWRGREDGTHIFSVNVSSSNAPSISSQSLRYGGDAVVTAPPGARLEQIKNSTTLCLDRKDAEELFKWPANGKGDCSMPNQVSIAVPDTLFQTGIGLGNLKPGYDHAAVVLTHFMVK